MCTLYYTKNKVYIQLKNKVLLYVFKHNSVIRTISVKILMMMKQKLHILGIVCLLLIFGCKKDDEKNVKAQIAGKWKMEKTTIKVYENGELSLDETETEFSDEDYYDFKPDGNLEIYTNGETDNAPYSVNEEGNKVTIAA